MVNDTEQFITTLYNPTIMENVSLTNKERMTLRKILRFLLVDSNYKILNSRLKTLIQNFIDNLISYFPIEERQRKCIKKETTPKPEKFNIIDASVSVNTVPECKDLILKCWRDFKIKPQTKTCKYQENIDTDNEILLYSEQQIPDTHTKQYSIVALELTEE